MDCTYVVVCAMIIMLSSGMHVRVGELTTGFARNVTTKLNYYEM